MLVMKIPPSHESSVIDWRKDEQVVGFGKALKEIKYVTI